MKPLSNDHIDERGDLMRKKAWFLCVQLVSLLFIGCTAKTNELEKSDPSGTLNAADPQQDPAVSEPNEQAMTVDDSAERLLLALKEATEVDSERLETQFFGTIRRTITSWLCCLRLKKAICQAGMN